MRRMMKASHNDNYAPERSDRSTALDLVRRTVEAGDAPLAVNNGMGRTLAARLEYVIRALELDGLADIRRAHDGRPLSAALTEFGTYVGERLAAGDVALMPALGGIKLIEPLERIRHRGEGRRLDLPASAGTPISILAIAPTHYGEDVVEGAATSVIIDPLSAWADHPVTRLGGARAKRVERAWEVFSWEGWSFGLVLETDAGFAGIDSYGGPSLEKSLSEAAWQVRVNC